MEEYKKTGMRRKARKENKTKLLRGHHKRKKKKRSEDDDWLYIYIVGTYVMSTFMDNLICGTK